MTKTPRKTRARKARPLDTERLKELAGEIEAVRHSPKHLTALEARLAQEHGLTVKYSSGTYTARMAGIAATATPGPGDALVNWANHARRAVLQAEAG